MKATIELPDDLFRAIKVKAARDDRTLKDLVADLLARGLASEGGRAPAVRRRVALPLVQCARATSADEEMTPERAAEVILDDDAAGVARR